MLLVAGASRLEGGIVSEQAVESRRFIKENTRRLTCKNKKLNIKGA